MLRSVTVLLVMLGLLPHAVAQDVYALDPRVATIGFSVSHMGLFVSEGQFRQFDSRLAIDMAHPERTRIDVRIAADSVDMSSPEGMTMLRSPGYFDVRQYPDIVFHSTTIFARTQTDYAIQGNLVIRGIRQPVTLSATLVNRHRDPATHRETVDFVVTGTVLRSAFGMLADRSFIADMITLRILARLQIAGAMQGG